MRQKEEKHMEERMMDTIVEIYNHMDDSDKDRKSTRLNSSHPK